MAAEGAAADGILPSVLPGEVPAYVITDYNFSWVELLHATQGHPGIADATPVLRRHWDTLTRVLARFEQDRGPDGLIRSQPGRRLFLDWSAQSRDEPNLTYNLRHLHALRLAADIAQRLGQPAPFADQAAATAAALRRSHLGPDGWRESPGGAPACQLALALLILTDTVTGPEAAALADTIEAGSATPASPFMHHYVFQALAHLDRWPAIRRLIATRWGPGPRPDSRPPGKTGRSTSPMAAPATAFPPTPWAGFAPWTAARPRRKTPERRKGDSDG